FAMAPGLYGSNAGYDPRKDFAPIGLIASYQQILVVHPSLPVRSIADLITLAKKEPGKITYATAGVGSGSHISTELLTSMAGINTGGVRARSADEGGESLAGTPEQQAADIDQEETKWGALVRKLGLRAE